MKAHEPNVVSLYDPDVDIRKKDLNIGRAKFVREAAEIIKLPAHKRVEHYEKTRKAQGTKYLDNLLVEVRKQFGLQRSL